MSHSVFSSFQQSLSHVQLFATLWTAGCQASLSIINSWRLFKLMSIESVMPSNHLILCHLLLLLPSIFPSIRVFSNESVLCIRWPKIWRFSLLALLLPMNIQDWFPLGLTGLIFLQSKGLSRVFSFYLVSCFIPSFHSVCASDSLNILGFFRIELSCFSFVIFPV